MSLPWPDWTEQQWKDAPTHPRGNRFVWSAFQPVVDGSIEKGVSHEAGTEFGTVLRYKGGTGSGNFHHAGRPGHVGGSQGLGGVGAGGAAVPAPAKAVARPVANPATQAMANAYAQAHGMPPLNHETYHEVYPAKGREIAAAYDAMPDNDSTNPAVREAYAALVAETKEQYHYAIAHGMTFTPWTKEGQPYANSLEMAADVRDHHHLFFFTGGEPHPLLGAIDPETGLSANDMFRAIHDYFGHTAGGYGFGPRGEENAWAVHSQMFSPEARKAMTTETRGQNSFVNFGPQNYDEKGNYKNLPLAERPFATQKAALLPSRFSDAPH